MLSRVIDTVGLYDTSLSEEDVNLELAKVLTECSDGVYAFLYVYNIGNKDTDDEQNTRKQLLVQYPTLVRI